MNSIEVDHRDKPKESEIVERRLILYRQLHSRFSSLGYDRLARELILKNKKIAFRNERNRSVFTVKICH